MAARIIASLAGGVCVALGSAAEVPSDRSDVIAAEVKERESGVEADHMTGDWAGLRSQLVHRGVHLQAGYSGEVLGNLSGGLKRGAIYEGLLEMSLRVDTERAGLWRGGTFQLSSLFPHGRGFSENYVGDLLTVSNIEAYESWRLYDLWYEHAFGEGLSARIGQFTADEEFAYTEPGGNFLNSVFGWPAFISGNTLNTGPAFYVAAPGIRFNYEPTKEVFVRAAVFDGDTFDNPEGDPRPNHSGTRFQMSAAQGFFGIAETGYRLNRGEKADGLPGQYVIGLWGHSGDFSSNLEDEAGEVFVVSGREPRAHSRNYGVYATAQQMLWREEEEQGLFAFLRAGTSPKDRSLFELVVDGGITVQGMIPTRDDDVAGVAAAYARISRDLRRAEQLDAEVNGTEYPGFSDHETVLEAFYTIQLAKWWTLQPDFQWVFNPGGNSSSSDAIILGVRTSLVF